MHALYLFYIVSIVGGQSASRQSEKVAFTSAKSSSAGHYSALSGKVVRLHSKFK